MKLGCCSKRLASPGEKHSMDVLDRLEIYIPEEAEVKSIPLWSLTNSVLRRMGLPLCNSDGSRKLADSPEGIWICPAVVRAKGQKSASKTGNGVTENMSSLLGREIRAASGPFRMSFVSSNRTAYKVLKETMPGQKVSMPGQKGSAHTSRTSMLPQGMAPQTYKGAVVIYHGRIYLSIKKPGRNHSQQETREPQMASQSSIPSTSDLSSKSQRKRKPPPASLEPEDKEPQRKSFRITLPQIMPKQPKGLLTKTDNHSTTDQELLNDNRPKKKPATCRTIHSDNTKDLTHKGRNGSSSKTACSVPQSTDSVHKVDSRCHKDAAGERAAEEPPGPETSWFRPQGEHEDVANDSKVQDLGGGESPSQSNDMDSSKADRGVDVVEQSGNQSWTRRESQGAASSSTSLQVDFNELAQEEKIARMMAKLRQNEAALSNLSS